MHKEFDLHFSTKPNVFTDIGRDRIWDYIESTLTEFIEALDLHEHMKVITEYTESYRDGYARAIREKLAIVDKFLGKEGK